MDVVFSEETAKEVLNSSMNVSQDILEDEDKLEKLFQRLEKKLKIIPVIGGVLSDIPLLASLVRSYVKKEYTDIPVGSILAAIGALAYFVSPIDLIPDTIPGAGYIDDGAVITVCIRMIDSDLKEYKIWRDQNGMTFDIPDFETNIRMKKRKKK